MTDLNALRDAAVEKARHDSLLRASRSETTSIGEVQAYAEPVRASYRHRTVASDHHGMRVTWKLNGKTVSFGKLEGLLSGQGS